jgi:hypothetical protein
VANDTHFITRAAKRELRRQADPVLDAGLVERVASYHRFHRMGLHRDDIMAAASGARTYSVFVSRLYDIRTERAGKTFSGKKTPDYCWKMPVLHRLLPSARFIHVARDGRDTALSTLRWAAKGRPPSLPGSGRPLACATGVTKWAMKTLRCSMPLPENCLTRPGTKENHMRQASRSAQGFACAWTGGQTVAWASRGRHGGDRSSGRFDPFDSPRSGTPGRYLGQR